MRVLLNFIGILFFLFLLILNLIFKFLPHENNKTIIVFIIFFVILFFLKKKNNTLIKSK